MKKSIWLAIIGAAALTGCQSEVMQERKYVPAPREDVEAAKPANSDPYATDRTGTEQVRSEQEPVPAAQELPPMTATFKNEGVNEDAPLADTGKKGGKKGGKAGKSAGKDAKAAPGEYIVKSGDTPEKIARKHHVRLAALMEANNLTEESAKKLRIGQKLVIPAKGGKATKGGNADKGGKRANAGAPAAGPGEYIVKSGDTPEKIARKHHVRLAALMEANNLSEEEARKLRIGQKLVIPAKGGKAGKKGSAQKSAPAKAPAPAPANDNANPAAPDLEDGVPAPAPAPAAETLQRTEVENGYLVDVPRDMPISEFARLAGVSEAELRKQNPNIPDTLKKDSSYRIPRN